MTTDAHDRIVTPDTDPDRCTPEEAAVYRSGRCDWQVSDGGWGSGDKYCREPSEPDASFGHCREHGAELLVDHYRDGSPRHRYAGDSERDPGYGRRADAAAEAHEQAERTRATRRQRTQGRSGR